MRLERSLFPILLVALSTGAAFAQEAKPLGPSPACQGAVSVEVERPRFPFPLPRAGPPPSSGLSGWSSRIAAAPELEWGSAFDEISVQEGTGWIVRQDGLVTVPSGFVEGATRITVTTSDGRRLPAERVQSDPATRIVVLRVEAQGLPAVQVATSGDLEPGAKVTSSGQCSREEGCSHPAGRFVAKVNEGRGGLVCLLSGRPSGSSALSWMFDAEGRVVGASPRMVKLPLPVGEALWIATFTPIETLKARIDEVPPRPAPEVQPWDWLWNEPDWPAPWEWNWLFPGKSMTD